MKSMNSPSLAATISLTFDTTRVLNTTGRRPRSRWAALIISRTSSAFSTLSI